MKKRFSLFMYFLLVIALAGCAQPETVFHVTKEYIQQSTGDINLVEYTYDETWQPTCVRVLLNGNFSSQTEYRYAEDGSSRIAEESSATLEPKTVETRWERDPQGNISKAEVYMEGQLRQTAVYTYDQDGRELTVKTLAPDSAYQIEVENAYDVRGNLVTRRTQMGENETQDAYSYNPYNRITGINKYRNGELTDRLVYEWDGDTSSCTALAANGRIQSITISTYDKWDNLLSQQLQDPNGNVIRTTWYAYIGEDGTQSGVIPE